jgi:chemotaxis protein MotB
VRKKHPEHVNLERWLVSYADFITLLFAFFVIMYAISQADVSKFKKVSASLKSAFEPAGPSSMMSVSSATGGGNTANPFDTIDSQTGRVINMPAGKTNTAAEPDSDLQNMKDKLEESISLELGSTDISDKVQMSYDSQGLVVRLAAKDFYEPGDVRIRMDMQPILDKIGAILASTKKLVRIEGHTDPSEASSEIYPTDWELSAARAAWAVRYFVKRFDIDPSRIGAAGYSHFRPLSEGASEKSKAKNRRIEIIILNNSYAVPQPTQ